jgi:hypothetical protein
MREHFGLFLFNILRRQIYGKKMNYANYFRKIYLLLKSSFVWGILRGITE